MDNPFSVPYLSALHFGPLCPWRHAEHDAFYSPVDHTQEAYSRFQDAVAAADVRAAGLYVLATGGEGCGKTSLLHRCAAWLTQHASSAWALESIIVDLSPIREPQVPVSDKVVNAASYITDELAVQKTFDSDLLEPLEQRFENPTSYMNYLEAQLAVNNRLLILLLPALELPAELEAYEPLVRKCSVVMAETAYPDVIDRSKAYDQRAGLPIMRLSVDAITEVQDGWTFVSNRLGQRTEKSVPTISEATVRAFMEKRIKNGGRAPVRELQLVCASVFRTAMEEDSATVSDNHFLQYYLDQYADRTR